MHISLTDSLDEYVRAKAAFGLCDSPCDVIREALRLEIKADMSDEARLRRLHDAIEPAWRQAENGECVPLDLKRIPEYQTVTGLVTRELRKSG